MKKDYLYTTIGEIAQVKGGKRLPKGWLVQDQRTAHPYIRVRDFTPDRLDPSDIKYIDDEVYKVISRYTITSDDVYISIAGTIGLVGIVPQSLSGANLTENAAKICKIDSSFDKRFLVYYLRSSVGQSKIEARTVGTSQPKLALFRIKKIPIPCLPLPTQRKIAAILSAYDALIENNTRRIALLEQTAQLLYREWFVHFRFPGHQSVPLVESELGAIPEGWVAKSLGEVCHLVIGQSPKSEFYNEDGEGLPFHQGVKDFSDLYPTTRVYCTVSKRVAEAGDILFSVRAPVGRMNITDKEIVIGRGLHAIRSTTGNQTYIFLQLKDKFHEEDMMGGGTIFKSVTKADVLGIQLVMPPDNLLAKFEQIATPMLSETKVLTDKNTNLRRTRDLLLPHLISGQLDVSELEILTGECSQ